ncbi:hypothetical protein BJ085DRAFT_40115 [Dimargaris cristalligena]|uniref:Uncharacterized protein n=1 Tax=Dimargaris cristalligena TaxID=215637 RepID=A0A4P9ZMJ8_9FUNG|nr:hypothetical protein BJ085DRAFT_40115 [Dimargaris cristalligena]|eukprot:RKP33520.1 hypothetical protein BJ085DRAFT_40115 [Dimargaris cristalligena]
MTTPNSAPVSSNSANLPSSTTRELAAATSGQVDKEAVASTRIPKAAGNRPDAPGSTNYLRPTTTLGTMTLTKSKSYPQMKVKRSMASILCSTNDGTPVPNRLFTRDQIYMLVHNSTTHRRSIRKPVNPHCLANLGSSSPPTAATFFLPAVDMPFPSPRYDRRGSCLPENRPYYRHIPHHPEDPR